MLGALESRPARRYKPLVIRRVVLGCSLWLASVCATLSVHAQATRAPRVTAQTDPPSIVRFRERRIDLESHLEAFPYLRFRASAEAGQLLYLRETREARELWTLPLADGAMSLDRGTRLGDADWSRRGLREVRYRAPAHEYIVLADDANEERFNLFALPLAPGAPMRRLTDRPYVYGFGLDRAEEHVAYIARYGDGHPFHSCLNVIELEARTDREVVCDTPEVTFTWTNVVFSPDGATVVISALRASDRNHENLVAVDLRAASPSVRLLTDPSRRRRNVDVERDWIDGEHFVFTSDEDGFTNVYVYDLAARSARAITHFTEDVTDIALFTVGTHPVVGAIVRRPYESELFVVDPADGMTLARRVFDATSTFLDHVSDHAVLESESRRTRFQLDDVRITLPEPTRVEIVVSPRASVPPDVAARIERCDVERVQIPTFDIDPHTGRPRLLHAFVQTPRRMPARLDQRVAFIEGFYGGENNWDTSAQILCDAGAIVVSPSVRGSSGFGAEFAALNDHDLGGNEVIDLMYIARDIARRFQLRPWQVGLFGGSHGGYEVLRAMTFPRGVNGRDEQFAWGFGVSWFAFSNIVTFFEHSNIPDWVLLEAGDPARERERLLDRSPVNHAALSTGPILLLHGESDRRVPVTESRQMAEALRAAHRPVRYAEFAGQGHGLKGLANQQRVWREVFGFLEPVLASHVPVYRADIVRPRDRRRARVAIAALLAIAVLLALATRAGRRSRES